MSARVRTDRTSGKKFCDFYLDQGARWSETMTYRTGVDDPLAPPVDVTGYTSRLIIRRADRNRAVAIDLTSELVIDGPAGTFTWDISAVDTALLIYTVYDYQLHALPAGNSALAFPLLEGRIVMRPMVADALVA